jgi:hypothetical protein
MEDETMKRRSKLAPMKRRVIWPLPGVNAEQPASKEDRMTSEASRNLVIDSDSLVAPWGPLGHVDEVNGRGALAVPEFIASRYELLVLLKHWTEIELDIRFWWFCFQMGDNSKGRLNTLAARRVNRIADALNDEKAVQTAIKEAQEAFGNKQDGLAWREFTGGATLEEESENDNFLSRGDASAMEDEV